MFYVVFCIVHSVNYEGHSRINNTESISQKVLLNLVLFVMPRVETDIICSCLKFCAYIMAIFGAMKI